MEDEEALESRTLVSQQADPVQDQADRFLADGVMTAGEVVGCVLLSGDESLRMKQIAVGTGADLVHHCGLQVHQDCSRNVLARARLDEEGVEGVVATADGVAGVNRMTVRLDAVLQAVQLPAGIAHLHSGLPHVDGNTLTHDGRTVGFHTICCNLYRFAT